MTDKPWRETVARHRAAYEAHCWEQDHPQEVAWLNSEEGLQFKENVRDQIRHNGFCRSEGCSNIARYYWQQCGPCYYYDMYDMQADWEREQCAEAEAEGGWLI